MQPSPKVEAILQKVLNEPDSAGSGRRSEAALLLVVEAMRQGWTPRLAVLSAAGARRAGYLAEMTAMLLDSTQPGRLRAFAVAAGRRVEGACGKRQSWPPVALLSSAEGGGPAIAGADDLATDWRLSAGLDPARLRSELPPLRETWPAAAERLAALEEEVARQAGPAAPKAVR